MRAYKVDLFVVLKNNILLYMSSNYLYYYRSFEIGLKFFLLLFL